MTFFKQFGFTGGEDVVRNKETDQLLAKDLTKSIDIQPNMTLKQQSSYTGRRSTLSHQQDHKADQQQVILAMKQQVQEQQHKLESKLALLKQVSNVDGISTPLNLGSQKPGRMQSRVLDYKLRYAERSNREDYYRNRANQLSDQLGYYNTFNSSDEKSASALKTQQQEVDMLKTQVEKMQAQMALLHKELESKEVTLQQHILIVDNLQQVVQQQQAKQIDQQEEFLQLNDRYSKQLQIAQAATIAKSKIELQLAELHDQYLKIKSDNLDMERKYNQMASEIGTKNALIEELQANLEKQTKKAQEKKEQLKQYQQLNIQLQQQQCGGSKKNIQRRMVQVSSSLKDNPQSKYNQKEESDEENQQEQQNNENFFRRNQQLNQSTEMRPEIDLSMKTESQINETIENSQQNIQNQNIQQLSLKEFGSDIYSKIQPNESHNLDIDISKNSGINFRQFKARSSNQTPDQLKQHQQEELEQPQNVQNSQNNSQSVDEENEALSEDQLPSNVLTESRPSLQEGLTDLGTKVILDSKEETVNKIIQANDTARQAEQVESRHGLDVHNAKLQLQEKVEQKLSNMFSHEVKLSPPDDISSPQKVVEEQQMKLKEAKKASEKISQLSRNLSEAVSRLENEDENQSKKQPLSTSISNLVYKLENGEESKTELTEKQQEELKAKGFDVIIHQSQLNEDFTNHSLQTIINKINNNEELPDLSESQEIQLKQLGYDVGPKVIESQFLKNNNQDEELEEDNQNNENSEAV